MTQQLESGNLPQKSFIERFMGSTYGPLIACLLFILALIAGGNSLREHSEAQAAAKAAIPSVVTSHTNCVVKDIVSYQARTIIVTQIITSCGSFNTSDTVLSLVEEGTAYDITSTRKQDSKNSYVRDIVPSSTTN